MSGPVVAANTPIKTALTQGEKYFFCMCGRSDKQPFCDGSHSGTGITPRKFVAEKTEDAFLCRCKHTDNAPYCDGTHKRFGADDVGKEVD